MPMPNYHTARVEDPKRFVKGTFRIKTLAPGVQLIVARKAKGGSKSLVAQAYHFHKCELTPSEAKRWLEYYEVRVKKFEPASSKCMPGDRKKYNK